VGGVWAAMHAHIRLVGVCSHLQQHFDDRGFAQAAGEGQGRHPVVLCGAEDEQSQQTICNPKTVGKTHAASGPQALPPSF
jgi:hypothetical protein